MTALKKNWFEWVVFAVGLVVVLGTAAYLLYDGLTSNDEPANFVIQFGEPVQQAELFTIPVTITNIGGETAEGVVLEATLERSGAEPERAQFEVSVIPRGSTREGRVSFRNDPRNGELKGRVLGYERP